MRKNIKKEFKERGRPLYPLCGVQSLDANDRPKGPCHLAFSEPDRLHDVPLCGANILGVRIR